MVQLKLRLFEKNPIRIFCACVDGETELKTLFYKDSSLGSVKNL